LNPKGSKNHVRKTHEAQRQRKEARREIAVNSAYQVHRAELLSLRWWVKGDSPKHMTRVFVVELKEPLFDREIRERLNNGFGDLNGHKKET